MSDYLTRLKKYQDYSDRTLAGGGVPMGQTQYLATDSDLDDLFASNPNLYGSGLGATTSLKTGLSTSVVPGQGNALSEVDQAKINLYNKQSDYYESKKPSPWTTGFQNALIGTQIGLGLGGFLDDRKTSKLQREMMRGDISAARAANASRQATNASFASVFGKKEQGVG